MSNGSLRRALTAVVVAAACITLSPHADAARNSGALERFVARAVSVEDPTEATRPIDILIERWSTDEEFDALRGSLVQYGPETLLPTLQKTWRRAGVLFTPGVMTTGARARLRRTEDLMVARQINTPTGRQVILAGDRHLQLGEEPASLASPSSATRRVPTRRCGRSTSASRTSPSSASRAVRSFG